MIDRPYTPYYENWTMDDNIAHVGWTRYKHENSNNWECPIVPVEYESHLGQGQFIDFEKCNVDTTEGNQWVDKFCLFSYGTLVKATNANTYWYAGDASITKIRIRVSMKE